MFKRIQSQHMLQPSGVMLIASFKEVILITLAKSWTMLDENFLKPSQASSNIIRYHH